MFKKPVLGLALMTAAALLLSCDTGYDMLIKVMSTEAVTLKSFCDQNNVKSPEIARADSLVALATVRQQNAQKEDAFTALDHAVIYYRLGLSKRELQKTESIVEKARAKLSDDEDQLATYKEVLAEMKGEKK